MTVLPDEPRKARPIVGLLFVILALFATGFAAGVGFAAFERGAVNGKQALILIAALGVLVGAAVAAQRFGQFAIPDRESRTGTAVWMLVLSGIIGMGLALSIPIDELGTMYLGGEQAPDWPAWRGVVGIFLLLVLTPLVILIWHRNADELNIEAVKVSALAAAYLYFILTPVWWMAWRSGFAPEPNGHIIYWVAMLTWIIVAAWRKYR